jgi:hypothetical protein
MAMDDPYPKYACLLTYLGALPFGIAMIFLMNGVSQERVSYILCTYGAVIVSFICGIHWGISMKHQEKKPTWLLASSNGITLVAWGCMILPSRPIALMTLGFCLFFLLLIDQRLYTLNQTDGWYIRMRWRVTGLVILSLAVSVIAVS